MNKKDIRNNCLAWRQTLSEVEWRSKSRAICSQLEELHQLQSAQTVHAFWPMQTKQEVDIRPLLNKLIAGGKTVLLPIMEGNELKLGPFTRESDLHSVGFGVLEPNRTIDVSPEEIDVVIVPALAVDLNGNRIGYGKGFYDRFLSTCNAVKIVPIFEGQVMERIPSEVHDVPVDMFVTEQRTHLVPVL